MFFNACLVGRQDFALAKQWYAKAVAQGYPPAMFRLGNIFFWGKGTEPDSAQALRLFQQATQKAWGHLQFDAINNLGLMYEQGKGVKADHKEALKYFRQAAEAGNPWGQYNMGVSASYDQKDEKEALRWWHLAARSGHARSAFEIGDAYFLGKAGKKDLVEAERWFITALQRGDKDAPRALTMVREERDAERKGQKK